MEDNIYITFLYSSRRFIFLWDKYSLSTEVAKDYNNITLKCQFKISSVLLNQLLNKLNVLKLSEFDAYK